MSMFYLVFVGIRLTRISICMCKTGKTNAQTGLNKTEIAKIERVRPYKDRGS